MLLSGNSAHIAETDATEKQTAETAPSAPKKDPDRFYCPYPGCNRSFAELWRLKVHYRAAPDVRGSGKERGHGAELESCPKCGAELKPGRHHVGCAAGKHAAAQQEKRRSLKGRKRGGCKETQPPAVAPSNDASLQLEGVSNQPTTAVGVPVSWLPLDFDQFFAPMQRHHHLDVGPAQLLPEHNSVYSWVYGNHGELPIMAMAQVGDDTDSDIDFLKYFNEINEMDPSFDAGFQPIKEELPAGVGLPGDPFVPFEVDPYSDGLDQYLHSLLEGEEEEMSEITGKKRERRTSLEQRTEQRNGKEQDRRRSICRGTAEPKKHLVKSEIKADSDLAAGFNVMPHFLRDRVDVPAFDPGINATLPMEVPLDLTNVGDSLMPYSIERGSEIGMLVQDMVGFDLHHNEGSSNAHKTEDKHET